MAIWVPVILSRDVATATKDITIASAALEAVTNKRRHTAVPTCETKVHRLSPPHGLYPTTTICCLFLQHSGLPFQLDLLKSVGLIGKPDTSKVLHVVYLKLQPARGAGVTPGKPATYAGLVENVLARQSHHGRPGL